MYMRQGKPKALRRAASVLQQALNVDAERFSLQSNLGEVYKLQRRFREAIPHYEAALRLAAATKDAAATPVRLADVHNNLAVALFEARGEVALPEIEAHYAAAVEAAPSAASPRDNLAQVLAHRGALAEAAGHIQELLHHLAACHDASGGGSCPHDAPKSARARRGMVRQFQKRLQQLRGGR